MPWRHIVPTSWWRTINDYIFRFRLFCLRPYRRQIKETRRAAELLKDELYQKYLVEEMKKQYHKDREAALLMALAKYKERRDLQQAFSETIDKHFKTNSAGKRVDKSSTETK
eukprot:jgi/Galph1/697/GphlegSOOS_G5499.1